MACERKERYICPLLKNPETYKPDTIDLETDQTARQYWLNCLENMVRKFVNKANYLNPDTPEAKQNAEICLEKFHNLVILANENPQILQPLSIRTLLEFNEDNLRNNNFKDAWFTQKHAESLVAFKEFENRLKHIDSIDSYQRKWLEIVTGVLAGNVFDWGSTIVADMLEKSLNFGLTNAVNTIEKRPWLQDNLDTWISKIQINPYREAVIFVDNAGIDFILGILPLTRQLLKEGTKVVLAANTSPALNDVTLAELKLYCNEAGRYCKILENALNCGDLLTVENGQKGPCLDLTNLSPELCKLMETVDLVMLEGMGRAIHTNLYAQFNVDSVKLAVLKNEWLAQRLGGKQFSVIFNYESAT